MSYMVHGTGLLWQNFQGERQYELITDLQLLKLSLRLKKLRVPLEDRQLDKGILDLMTEEDDFAEEIKLADECWEKLQLALIDLETALASEGT